ncbi:hypothetical protein HanRHA438_Chr06g0274351 [Helianthus annuus]|nr:hypothetical protein HanRHA438_Chr06g0274351 [Helianthus annuus]
MFFHSFLELHMVLGTPLNQDLRFSKAVGRQRKDQRTQKNDINEPFKFWIRSEQIHPLSWYILDFHVSEFI